MCMYICIYGSGFRVYRGSGLGFGFKVLGLRFRRVGAVTRVLGY